jgi:hypothetical protein
MSLGPLLAILALTAQSPADSIYGTVRSSSSQDALRGVIVETVDGNGFALSDSLGRYVLAVNGEGGKRLRFGRLGFSPFVVEVAVSQGQSLRLDIDLDPLPAPLPPIEVRASSGSSREPDTLATAPAEIGLRRYDAEALHTDPLTGNGDPILAAVGSPTSDAVARLRSSLRVHGGNGDQNQILLDGVPVYGAMHLGGVASLFNPDVVGSIDLHPTVPPASLSGRLSSAIEVQLRPLTRNEPMVAGASTSTWARQTVGLPLAGGRASLLVSGQRSYRGLFAQDRPANEKPNGFADLLLSTAVNIGRGRLALYVLHSSDHLGFPTIPQIRQPDGTPILEGARNRFDWSTRTEALVWRFRPGGALGLTARAWHAGADASVSWPANARSTRMSSALSEIGLGVELRRESGPSHDLLGVVVHRSQVINEAEHADLGGGLAFAPTVLQAAPTIVGVFGEIERSLRSRWTVSLGLRGNYLVHEAIVFEPRLSIRYKVSPRIALSTGYSRVHQYVQSLRNEESPLDHAFGADLLMAVGSGGLKPARTDQLAGGLEAVLARGLALRLGAYTRSFTNVLVVPAVTTGPFADRPVPMGSGHAEGVELEVTHSSPKLRLRLDMGAAATQRQAVNAEFHPGAQGSRWLALGTSYRWNELTTLHLGGTWEGGAATTPISGDLLWQSSGPFSQGGEISGSPQSIIGALGESSLPAYFRVDAGLERQWNVNLGNRGGVLRTSITLTNLFNRRNSLALIAGPGLRSRPVYFPSQSLNLLLSWGF